jgi:hypothetical protein
MVEIEKENMKINGPSWTICFPSPWKHQPSIITTKKYHNNNKKLTKSKSGLSCIKTIPAAQFIIYNL